MLSPHIDKKSAVPWWAAFGAPLLGVPLLVGMLALSAPASTAPADTTDTETEASWVSDEHRVEAEHADRAVAEARATGGGDTLARC